MNPLVALFKSRKFYVGAFSVLGIFAASVLRALDKIPPEALLPTITGIAGLGATFIAATAAEDSAAKIADSKKAMAAAIHENAKSLVTIEQARNARRKTDELATKSEEPSPE